MYRTALSSIWDVDRFFDWGFQGIYNIFGEKVMFVSLCYFEINYIKINATKEDIFLIPEDNLDKLSYGVELRIMITVKIFLKGFNISKIFFVHLLLLFMFFFFNY